MFRNTNRNNTFYDTESTNYESDANNYSYNNKSNKSNDRSYNFHVSSSLTWIQKTLIIAIIILLMIVLVFVGGILLNIFFTIAIPLLLIYIVYKIIKEALK